MRVQKVQWRAFKTHGSAARAPDAHTSYTLSTLWIWLGHAMGVWLLFPPPITPSLEPR